MKTKIFSKALIGICTVLFFASCGENQERTRTDRVVKVKEMTVGETSISGESRYSGTVEEENATSLSFSSAGTVKQIRVKVGDRVAKGQLIASIEQTTARSAYDMAHATLVQVEDAYRRMEQLHDKGSLSEIKWVEIQSQLSQARSAEKIAKKGLEDCTLYSPCAGVVSEKMMEEGQTAAPGMPVVRIASVSELNVKVSVPESEMSGIRMSEKAEIEIPALGNRRYSGTVVEKGVVADALSRSYAVKVRIMEKDATVLPGMVATVRMSGAGDAKSEKIVVPARLLQLSDDGGYFLWLDVAGKAQRRSVVVGAYTADGVEITTGLQNGDKVITEGQQKVCNGTKLTK